MTTNMEHTTKSTQSKESSQNASKEKNQLGRPTKKTTELVEKLIEAFHDDATIEQACYIAGIHKTSYYDWIKEDEEFSYEMSKAQEYSKVLAKRVLIKAMENGDEKTAMDFIKRREKDRYSERNEMTGADGAKLEIAIVEDTRLKDGQGTSTD